MPPFPACEALDPRPGVVHDLERRTCSQESATSRVEAPGAFRRGLESDWESSTSSSSIQGKSPRAREVLPLSGSSRPLEILHFAGSQETLKIYSWPVDS